jgi:4-hydroxy-tetrahydrodipicolinate synthase
MTAEQAAMIRAYRDGHVGEARVLDQRVQRLADAVFADPVGAYRVRLKECLVLLGVLEVAHVRPPLGPISARERSELRHVLADVGALPVVRS